MSQDINEEKELVVVGVPGKLRLTGNDARKPGCWMHQKWVSERRTKTVDGETLVVEAEIRFDDNCGNGHNSFAITGNGWYDRWKSRDYDFCGCIHDKVAALFPELEHLIKWHLVSTDAPMHYVANTVYHASNLHNGKAKGEPNAWENRVQFGNWPITMKMSTGFMTYLFAALKHRKATPVTNPERVKFEVIEIPHTKKPGETYDFKPKYSFDGYEVEWYRAPFDSRQEAEEFAEAIKRVNDDVRLLSIVTGYSEGKERDLDAARSCAAWPDATDEQLCLPAEELTKLLEARLPAMLAEFRADVEAAGFLWERSGELK